MDWLQRNAQKRTPFTHFSPFSAQKIFFSKTPYAISKVVYQASLIPKFRKIYGLVAETCSKHIFFHIFFAIFGPKKIFSCKTAYTIYKLVHQASHILKIRKIYGLVAKKC